MSLQNPWKKGKQKMNLDKKQASPWKLSSKSLHQSQQKKNGKWPQTKERKTKSRQRKNLPGCGGERWVAGSQDPKAKAKNKQGVCEPGVRICQLL